MTELTRKAAHAALVVNPQLSDARGQCSNYLPSFYVAETPNVGVIVRRNDTVMSGEIFTLFSK